MRAVEFCYFLQGYMELANPETISEKDLEMIKGHLKLAFRDDIDPSMGTYEHQMELSAAHEGMNLQEFFEQYPHLNPHGNNLNNGTTLERC